MWQTPYPLSHMSSLYLCCGWFFFFYPLLTSLHSLSILPFLASINHFYRVSIPSKNMQHLLCCRSFLVFIPLTLCLFNYSCEGTEQRILGLKNRELCIFFFLKYSFFYLKGSVSEGRASLCNGRIENSGFSFPVSVQSCYF